MDAFEKWVKKNYGKPVGEFTIIFFAIVWVGSFGVAINVFVIC
jgi:hypothetical protein